MTSPANPPALGGGHQPANLGDILERVLDRGLVIVGDIRINLLDIELLTVKLRLLVASVDTARELGIDWWEHDPWLTSGRHPSADAVGPESRDAIEPAERAGQGDPRALGASPDTAARGRERDDE